MYRFLTLLLVVLSADVFAVSACSNQFIEFSGSSHLSNCQNALTSYSNGSYICRDFGFYSSIYRCNTGCPAGYVCSNDNCRAGTYYDENTGQCISGEEPLQCDQIGFAPNESNTECEFVGCPVGYATIGKSCSELPPSCDPGEITVCKGGYCSCEPPSCSPSHPDYSGSENGTDFCNKPPPQCSPGEKSGYATVVRNGVAEYIQICVSASSGEPVHDDPVQECTGGKVSINGDCAYPSDYIQEGTTIHESVAPDGSKTVTTTNKKVTTGPDGKQVVVEESTTDFFDSDGNLIGSDNQTSESDAPVSESVVRGGGDCMPSDKPECVNADAVDCAVLQQIWLARCEAQAIAGEGDDFDGAGFAAGELGTAQSDANSFDSQLSGLVDTISGEPGEFDQVLDFASFNIDYTPEYGSCPSDIPLDLGDFGTIALPLSTYCTEMALFATVVRFMASLIAFWVVFNTLREL